MSTQNETNQIIDEQTAESDRPSGGFVFWGIIAILGGLVMILSQFMALDTIMPWITLALGVLMLLWGILGRSAGGLFLRRQPGARRPPSDVQGDGAEDGTFWSKSRRNQQRRRARCNANSKQGIRIETGIYGEDESHDE